MAFNISSALVIGGGFSGASAAIELCKRGVQVDLVELNPEWGTYGAGISIGGPTLRALRTLGVLDRFLEEGYACDGTDILTPEGELIAQLPTPRIAGAAVPGSGAIMRPVLGRILAEAATAAGTKVKLGCTVDSLAEDECGVDVTFTDGTNGRYDLVVGADGLYSKTRGSLFPDAPEPRYNGQGVWRTVLPRPADVIRTMLWVGDHVKVGLNPVSQSEMYLFVNENRPVKEFVPSEQLLPRLRRLLVPFSAETVRQAREQLDESSLVIFRPIEGLLVSQRWYRGRVVLIGDAVHATTPHLAAGAGIGIEDAIVLADELSIAESVDAALRGFQARRWERCRMVVEDSARLGEIEIAGGDKAEHARIMAESFAALTEPI